jgi:hypothetical protein|tara:strand:- start:1167 stop:1598 length:432 start_codon:yes stop_codon:yes gene_type:complete
MASNINFPENSALWFVEGDKLALITKTDSSGNSRTTDRKLYKAIQESITDGLLIHYYGEPNSVVSINDTPDIDNTLHVAIVDYVKKCLYMDKAGASSDPGVSQSAMQMMVQHERRFNETVKRYGMRKRDKTGGTRAILPYDFR